MQPLPPKHCSSGPQTPILMFFTELKGHEQSLRLNLESHKDEILFHEHESSAIQKSQRHSHESPDSSPPCGREVQQVLHPF